MNIQTAGLLSCLATIALWIVGWALLTTAVMITGPYLFPDHYSWSWLQAFVFVFVTRALVAPLSFSAK